MLKQLGILLSGRGSNFEAIADHIERGDLVARIAVVVSNVSQAPGLEKARRRGLDAVYIDPRGISREEFDRRLISTLQQKQVDLVCLAGFMRLLSPVFIGSFPQRILNIHPSLLPAFPGLIAQKQALEYGVKFTGCTVHIVDEKLDAGPIILQATVPVLDDDNEDSLSARILVQEHQLYSKAIRLVLENRIKLNGRRVFLMSRDGK
jgi:phosphoribosylglycinamide formyltransferase 1